MVLLITYVILQTKTTINQPVPPVGEISQSLDTAVSAFDKLTLDLETQSDSLIALVERAHNTLNPKMAVFQRVDDNQFWGITILRENETWLWKKFELTPDNDSSDLAPNTTIILRNNVTILQRSNTVDIDGITYTFLTAKLVNQTIDLPFENQMFEELPVQSELKNSFPVTYNFFGSQPENSIYRILSIAENDSVGTVYAIPENSTEFLEKQQTSRESRLFLFHVGLLLTFFITLFFGAYYRSSVIFFFLYIILVLGCWILLISTGIPFGWAHQINEWTSYGDQAIVEQLTAYVTGSVFLVLLFFGINNILLNTQKPAPSENHFRTIGFSILLGLIATLFIIYPVYNTYTTLLNSGLSLIELQLAPGIPVFIFYVSSLLLTTSALGIIIAVGYALNIREGEKPALVILISSFSFVVFYVSANFITQENLLNGALTLSSLFFLVVVMTIIFNIHSNYNIFVTMSGFRRMMLLILSVSVGLYGLIWSTHQENLDEKLLEQVDGYVAEDTQSPDQILYRLLSDIESDLRTLTLDDIQNNRQPVSNLFQQTMQKNLQVNRELFSFHFKLIDNNNIEISNYSTSIDTPVWNPFFDIDVMLPRYRGEQIRWQNNRPVIWNNPSSTTLSERFTTYDIGWIPIYDQQEPSSIIAWVTGDIFKERLDYNKPIRAVLSAATDQAWKDSYYISEYVGDRLNSTVVSGIYHNQPHYHKLPTTELQLSTTDSVNFFTNITRDHSFREVLVRHTNDKIIKASTPLPGINLHVFSFFKMLIVMVFLGLFCCSIFASMGFHHFSLFGQSQKFSSRLIDGLALSTILFLTVLIFATRFTLTNQNEKNIERNLLNDLNGINESIKEKGFFTYGDVSPENLSEITTPLNIDLILYRGSSMEISTTPQIFQQHILPTIIPFDVYDNLYNRERATFFTTTVINNEKLLIGYKSILNTDGRPVGAIAIPTFIESPVFIEQLLQATSYLFVVYLVIFALFIGGTVFLSNRLTKPLKLIQQGLQKISRGTKESKVPVTSRDEIGLLAVAYNNMVTRLDEARRELVKAERETAWKEMAQQVAHEIKNPLTPMKLNLQHLQRQLENNPEDVLKLKPLIERTATNIIEQIETLNKIASDFSKFAKPMQAPKKNLNIHKLIESVTALYEQDESVLISLKPSSGQFYILGADDELRRAFINIIKNGIEAVATPPAHIHITLTITKESVQISVCDNGAGISETNGNQIFMPQFSTKSSGTGLGLAITKKIIQAHNGTISVDKTSASGTTFLITFPLSQ